MNKNNVKKFNGTIQISQHKGVVNVENITNCLPVDKPEYGKMLSDIQVNMPAIKEASSNFYKSHSQFMGVTVDITALTPLRSIKHTLAEIDQTKNALTGAYISVKKHKNKLAKLSFRLEQATDPIEKESLSISIEEKNIQIEESKNSVGGAVRKLSFFISQYNNLLSKINKDYITEEDYEKEETKYHIMTAIKQGLTAARSKNGVIDEGNHIYFFELGINGAQAQLEFDAYFHTEMELLKEGKAPTHEMTLQWIEALAEKWAQNPIHFAERRGFKTLEKSSLVNLRLDNEGE